MKINQSVFPAELKSIEGHKTMNKDLDLKIYYHL